MTEAKRQYVGFNEQTRVELLLAEQKKKKKKTQTGDLGPKKINEYTSNLSLSAAKKKNLSLSFLLYFGRGVLRTPLSNSPT